MTAAGTTGLRVRDVLANAARAAPDAAAVMHGESTLTFAELQRAGTSFSASVQARGARPGDVAVVLASTSVEQIVAFAGCAHAGVVFAPLNPGLSADVVTDVLARARPRLLLVDETTEDQAASARGPSVVRIDSTYADDPTEPPPLAEDDPHAVFFTSGSTGVPKGVVLSNRVSVLRSHPGSQLEPRGPALCPYPLFHMAGWTIGMQQWHARSSLVLLDRADPADIVAATRRHAVERINAVPAVWQRLLDHLSGTPQPALDSLRFADTGTSATPRTLLEEIGAVAPNAAVRVFYGSTEAGNVTSLAPSDIARKPGSCGQPSPLTEVRIGASDELHIRGPLLFSGYLNDDVATTAAFDGDWFRTGDVARSDDEGYLTIVGRLAQIIRTGGESVSPARVESVLSPLEGIDDFAIVGLPDDRWGELVCIAVVVGTSAAPPTLEELRAGAAQRLARHEIPRVVRVVDVIPRTAATGQVDRAALRASLR